MVHRLLSLSENVGFVVVAGSYLTVTADKVLCLHIVVDVAVRVVLAVADLSKLHTSKGKKWLLIQVIKRYQTTGLLIHQSVVQKFKLVHSLTGV